MKLSVPASSRVLRRPSLLRRDRCAGAWISRPSAQRGEDTLREHDLVLRLRDDLLQLRWSEDFGTRPLLRCD